MATLVIGIGTTGLKVLEAAQQFNYEFLGTNTPPKVKYVFIDTEKASKSKATALGRSNIEKISIPLDGIQGAVANLRENENFDSSWVPSSLAVAADSGAAGGRPTYGRLAFWIYFNEINNLISKFAQKEGEKNILVVGSLTGGTGSGICIDLAYLIRHHLRVVDLQAVFMTPSSSDYTPVNKVLFENCYQALRSLEFFSLTENQYEMTTPNGNDISSMQAPYDLISIVSQDYDQNNRAFQATRMKTLSELINSVGLYVSTLFLPSNNKTFKQAIEERRKDAKDSYNHLRYFSSFGISMAQYPKRLLEEYVAVEYSEKTINHWKDFELMNNSAENKARANADILISDAIEKSLNIIINNKPLDQYIQVVKNQILLKKFEGHPDINSYLDYLFMPKGSIYSLLLANMTTAQDTIVTGINRDVKNILKDPVLREADKYLKSLSEYFDRESKNSILKYWLLTFSLDGTTQGWLKIYKHLKDKLFKERNNSKFFLQEDSFLTERLEDIVNLLKMNLLFEYLERISMALKDSNNLIYASGKRLINRQDLQNMQEVLKRLLDNAEQPNLKSRAVHISANNTSYAQIYYYYKQNVFFEEIEGIKKIIRGQGEFFDTTGNELLNNKSLLDFLCTDDSSFKVKTTTDLYFSILPRVVIKISDILSKHNDGVGTIYDLVQQKETSINRFVNSSNDLSKSPPAFMNHTNIREARGHFEDSPCLKLIVIGDNTSSINQLASNEDLTNDNMVEITDLKDTIMVFREYAYYGDFGDIYDNTLIPTRDIESLTIVKKNMIKNLENKSFITDRMPYLNQYKIKHQTFDLKKEFNKLASHDTL